MLLVYQPAKLQVFQRNSVYEREREREREWETIERMNYFRKIAFEHFYTLKVLEQIVMMVMVIMMVILYGNDGK